MTVRCGSVVDGREEPLDLVCTVAGRNPEAWPIVGDDKPIPVIVNVYRDAPSAPRQEQVDHVCNQLENESVHSAGGGAAHEHARPIPYALDVEPHAFIL